MAARILPDADFLRAIFNYDPETGELRHKLRDRSTFATEIGFKRSRRINVTGKKATIRSRHGYDVVDIKGLKYPAHRIAYKMHHGIEPPPILDHINRIRHDNRIVNIRPATSSQNLANCAPRGATGIKGVCFDKSRGKYLASIRIKGKWTNLGRFATAEEASAVYKAAAIIHHGEFASF